MLPVLSVCAGCIRLQLDGRRFAGISSGGELPGCVADVSKLPACVLLSTHSGALVPKMPPNYLNVGFFSHTQAHCRHGPHTQAHCCPAPHTRAHRRRGPHMRAHCRHGPHMRAHRRRGPHVRAHSHHAPHTRAHSHRWELQRHRAARVFALLARRTRAGTLLIRWAMPLCLQRISSTCLRNMLSLCEIAHMPAANSLRSRRISRFI